MYDLTARPRSFAPGSPRFGPPSSRGTQASGPEGAVSVGEIGPTPSGRGRGSPLVRVASRGPPPAGPARPGCARHRRDPARHRRRPRRRLVLPGPAGRAHRLHRPAGGRDRRRGPGPRRGAAPAGRRVVADRTQGRWRLRVGHRGQRRVGGGRGHPRHRRPGRSAGRLGTRVERLGRPGREPSRGRRRAAEDRPVAGHHAGRHRGAAGPGRRPGPAEAAGVLARRAGCDDQGPDLAGVRASGLGPVRDRDERPDPVDRRAAHAARRCRRQPGRRGQPGRSHQRADARALGRAVRHRRPAGRPDRWEGPGLGVPGHRAGGARARRRRRDRPARPGIRPTGSPRPTIRSCCCAGPG